MEPQSIAHYRLTGKLGEGGMGAVYRATDTKLAREVAIKVLPDAFANDADRLMRFTREAQVLASLNHPNIAAVYGIEERAIVMELVEGPTLADRLERGALPLEEALSIASQIAEAVEVAHEKNIVHRDLKPANIKVTEDGKVKVLDFGLAKLTDPREANEDPAAAPTVMKGHSPTVAGVIMGTAGYMPPEQAKGKSVDKRADVWAFGVVLFEMLVGKSLYDGETGTEIMAAVILKDANLNRLPSDTPRPIRKLVERCLEKDPRQRLRDIGEARIAIQRWRANPLEEVPAQPASIALRGRAWAPWALAAALALLAAGGWYRAAHPTGAAQPDRSAQFLVEAPADTQFTAGPFGTASTSSTAISPDGRYLVFSAETQGAARLWLRPIDTLSARPLQGADGANLPFWSPDSKSVAFFADGKLKRSEIVGGAPRILCDAPSAQGGAWSRDGIILFGSSAGLFRLPASGGVPQPFTQLDAARKESRHSLPQFLPGGKRFLYFIESNDANTQGIYAGSLNNPADRHRVLATDFTASYAPALDGRNGFLLWLREQTLVAQPFDAEKLRLEGEAIPLAEGVSLGRYGQTAAFWTSDVGLLVYRTGGARIRSKLIWMGRDGKLMGEAQKENNYASIRLSPDGKRLAMDMYTDRAIGDIWVLEFSSQRVTRLTFDPKEDAIPVWSPDGRQIAYTSDRTGVRQLYRKDAGGGGQEERLMNSVNYQSPTDWSRDGRYLLYTERDPKTAFDIWVLPLDGQRKPAVVLQTPFDEMLAQFSPDGKWIAYQSNQSGREEIYIRGFPNGGGQWQVSNQGGSRPRWSGDGKELYYLAPNSGSIMAASIRVAGASIEADAPRQLFAVSVVAGPFSPYAVTPDGQRFLVVQPLSATQRPAPLTVVTNWQVGLKK